MPAETNELWLAYSAFPVTPSEEGGVTITRISEKFKPRGNPQVVLPIKFKSSVSPSGPRNADDNFDTNQLETLNFISNGIQQGPGLGFAGRERNQNNSPNSGWILAMDRTGVHDPGITHLGNNTTNVNIIPLPPTNGTDTNASVFFGDSNSNNFVRGTFGAEFPDEVFGGDLDGYLLIGSGTDIDGSYLPRNYDNDIPGQNADLPIRRSSPGDVKISAKEPFAHLIYPRDGKIFTKDLFLKKNGKVSLSKKEVLRFSHDGTIRWLESASVPELGVRAMVWGRFVNAASEEVRIHIY